MSKREQFLTLYTDTVKERNEILKAIREVLSKQNANKWIRNSFEYSVEKKVYN